MPSEIGFWLELNAHIVSTIACGREACSKEAEFLKEFPTVIDPVDGWVLLFNQASKSQVCPICDGRGIESKDFENIFKLIAGLLS